MTTTMKQIEAFDQEVIVPGSIKGGMAALNAGRRDLWQVEPDKLRIINGFNPRVQNEAYQQHVRQLADSMLDVGFMPDQPLGGYSAKENGEDLVYLYSGHSRLAAVKIAIKEGAPIQHVPVVVSSAGMSMEDLTIALIRGNTGRQLSYYESAVVCQRLQKFGYHLDKIAEHTGFAVGVVRNRLTLMSAPMKLKTMVANEEISPTLALEMFSEYGDQVLAKLDEAVATAKENGKDKIRKVSVPDPEKKAASAVKKAAHEMHVILKNIRGDAGYMSLTIGNREYLEKVLDDIEPPAPEDTSATSTATPVAAGGTW